MLFNAAMLRWLPEKPQVQGNARVMSLVRSKKGHVSELFFVALLVLGCEQGGSSDECGSLDIKTGITVGVKSHRESCGAYNDNHEGLTVGIKRKGLLTAIFPND